MKNRVIYLMFALVLTMAGCASNEEAPASLARGNESEATIKSTPEPILEPAFEPEEEEAKEDEDLDETPIEHFEYKYDSSLGGIEIYDIIDMYREMAIDIRIPKVIDGISVVSIREYAFDGCSSITITIPDSVTSIGRSAFRNCTSLTDIIIPDSVTSIGRGAFSGCISLTSIIIPDGVTKIERNVFYNCTSLTNIIIPDGVTSIGDSFENCTSLTSITIPDSVTKIGTDAFLGCISLTSVTIPDSVTSIGRGAFAGCTSLTSIIIPDNVMFYSEWGDYEDGVFVVTSRYFEDNIFEGCENLTNAVFKGVTYKAESFVDRRENPYYNLPKDFYNAVATNNDDSIYYHDLWYVDSYEIYLNLETNERE